MDFLIADTFTDSLGHLTGDEPVTSRSRSRPRLFADEPGQSRYEPAQAGPGQGQAFPVGAGRFRPLRIKVNGVDMFPTNSGEVRSDSTQRPLQGPENNSQDRN